MKRNPLVLLLVAFALLLTPRVWANPTFDTFGALPGATFGGTSIPNDWVAISTYTHANNAVTTLGLTAHQRYGNPALTNDGAGTFFAEAGGDVLNGQPNYAKWNIGFYVSGMAANTGWKFFYDFNPAFGNGDGYAYSFGQLNLQDSWNLGMNFLGGPQFDPNALGEYTFSLALYKQGVELERSSINVVVQSVPDGGLTALMLSAGLVPLGLMARRDRSGRASSMLATG